MDLKLTDKRALVSGSQKGIGFAIATALSREGAQVAINGRTEASVSAALSEIRALVPARQSRDSSATWHDSSSRVAWHEVSVGGYPGEQPGHL